ncbi:hypothetical protein TKK_0007752 [Trichogramma kaykai]|uniref:Translation initiation factor eIF2B subunit gamma n=1 Tax=Trichogramma kaykai TaxID=54128 RepID=A0ABD2X7N3_9HYME
MFDLYWYEKSEEEKMKIKKMGHSDFQAVVLAGGKGSRMTELTAGKPKCLLPIANLPMIYYPLHFLERSGFNDAIVVVSETVKTDVISAIEKLNLKIQCDVVGVEDSEDIGTADSLRIIHEKIHKDLLIVPTDLITDIDISETLNLYRSHDASITGLYTEQPKIPEDFIRPGPKSKQKPETDLIGVGETSRLLFLASASDFEEYICMSGALTEKHPTFVIHSHLVDTHVYMISKWVLKFLVQNKSFSTLKGELLPYIVRKQMSNPQQEEEKSMENPENNVFKYACKPKNEKKTDFEKCVRDWSSYNDHKNSLDNAYHDDIIRCYAHIIQGKTCIRANTVQTYSLSNAIATDIFELKKEGNVENSSISSKAVVKCTQLQNCRIDDNAQVSEKTSLKNSYFSYNVVVKPKTRIQKSVLMNDVVVNEKCVIENSIICNGAIIEDDTVLKNCIVGANFTVSSGDHDQEVLTDTDGLMEIE